MKDKILAALIVFSIAGLVFSGFLSFKLVKLNDDLLKANTVIEVNSQEFQRLDEELGVAKSTLLTTKALAEKYEEEVSSFKKELTEKNEKIRHLKLGINSRDETIAGLMNSATGNTTVVIKDNTGQETDIDGKVISYTWNDNLERFKLHDPDISKDNNEVFTYKQYVKVKGLVLSDDSGNIKIKKIEIHEMSRHEDDLGKVHYRKVDGGDFTLIDSEFEYTNKEENDRSLLDAITLRPLALFDTGFRPGLGVEFLNFGNYLDFVNVGVYGKVAIDLSNPLAGSLQKSTVGLGINYHIIPPTLPTNFAVGLSLNTPLDDVGKMMVMIDVMVYLTEDLSPFK